VPTEIGWENTIELLEKDAQLVEVLSAKEYERVHLAKAINLPLAELSQAATGRLDQQRPVILYCYDNQ
jgi:rhodanese-related sulfurtransferase